MIFLSSSIYIWLEQALGCVGFDPNDPRREPWTGKWPGEADCERLGFFINGDRSLPDLNRLFAECRWNPEQQWWERGPAPRRVAKGALTEAFSDGINPLLGSMWVG
jgi:hypothetical protein